MKPTNKKQNKRESPDIELSSQVGGGVLSFLKTWMIYFIILTFGFSLFALLGLSAMSFIFWEPFWKDPIVINGLPIIFRIILILAFITSFIFRAITGDDI